MSKPRILVLVLLLGLTGWILSAVFTTETTTAAPQSFTSSTDCKSCHEGVYAEWKSSWHALSWDDPDVRSLSQDFANTDCIDCHAPRPVFSTGIGKRVLPRSSRRSEGVDCISCHMLPNGGVAGTIDNPSAPCRPQSERDLQREEFCAVCHDQHQTVEQWRTSKYAEQGIGCIECHMPYRNNDPNQGRDHRCLGGHDIELVRSAVQLSGKREGDQWIVTVENVGAGHSYPADERSRASDVFWRPLAASGETPEAWRHLYRFRSPYRYEVDVPDTLLLVHEARAMPPIAASAEAIEVALFYKLTPYYADPDHPDPDNEARLVHRIELKP